MRKSDSSIITIVGMRGCGKSTLTSRLSANPRFARKVVFDIVEEWKGTHQASTFEQFAGIWRETFYQPNYTIVIRYAFGIPADQIIELQTQICKLVYLTGRESGIETCIIFEEAQFYFPNHGLHPNNLHMLTTGRHAHINIIANTQRPASISKLLISQSAEIYIGQLYEMNDMKYLYDTVGDLALEARNLKPLEFLYYPVGYPEEIKLIEI